ncbi:MAG: TIM barrel protein [Candidatus Latescibacterota bacterium]
MKRTIGCTSRPYAKLDYPEAYARIAAAGYTEVAVFANQGRVPIRADSTPQEVADVRRAAADAGLYPSMVIGGVRLDLGADAAVEEYRRLIHSVAELGARYLLDCGTGNRDDLGAYCEVMRRAAPLAAEACLSITLKPHGGITLTGSDLARVCRRVGHPAFGACYDPGNIVYYTGGELRPEKEAEQVAGSVTTAIIKDCVLLDGKPDVAVTAGDGVVDFPRVLAALAVGGFNGPYYVECVGGSDPADVDRDLAFTRGYVRGILEAQAAGRGAAQTAGGRAA